MRSELLASDEFVDWITTDPDVRARLASSEAFRASFHAQTRFGAADASIPVDVEVTPAQLDAAFARVEATWEQVGADEPYWSVLSADRFKQDQLADTEEFYASGRHHAGDLVSILARHAVAPGDVGSCLEFGCGVGRVTEWLAREFPRVVACDISRPHLDLTAARLEQLGLDNVELVRVAGRQDLTELPAVDLVYSIMVLQHTPPPIMAFVLARLLDAIAPGGHGVLQLPTHDPRYHFDIDEYLAGGEVDGILMHVLPQPSVFDIIRSSGCQVLEVHPDHLAGMAPRTMSNVFVVGRPA